jgi:hypothetical protein
MTELFIVGQIDALEFESKFWSEFHGLRDISDKDVTARDPGRDRDRTPGRLGPTCEMLRLSGTATTAFLPAPPGRARV